MRTTFDWPEPPDDDQHGDVTIVRFSDKKILDEQNIQMIRDDLFRLIDEHGRRKLLLNFARVEFLSSAALDLLVRVHKRLNQLHGKLVLCGLSKTIAEIFVLTKLNRYLSITLDEKAGLAAF
jgi:anti-sigma B factor antagonist